MGQPYMFELVLLFMVIGLYVLLAVIGVMLYRATRPPAVVNKMSEDMSESFRRAARGPVYPVSTIPYGWNQYIGGESGTIYMRGDGVTLKKINGGWRVELSGSDAPGSMRDLETVTYVTARTAMRAVNLRLPYHDS